MHFELKGDYFANSFHRIKSTSRTGADEIIEKVCPANTNQELWRAEVFYNHVDKVIESANSGYKIWRTFSFEERANYLNRYKEIVLAKKDLIANAIALETGKPLWEALTEASALVAKVEVTLKDSLDRVRNQTYENIMQHTDGLVQYKPLGPSLVIGPFNFPCHLANGQILSALIAGNSIIFKPSEKTAYSAQLMIECLNECQFPSGVINLIQGGAQTALRLIKEKTIKGIYFTGSKEVGKIILKHTHNDLSKLVALELGGKNTTIVHKDANKKHAMAELLKSCFLTSGQRCTSTSIIAIHDDIKDEFIKEFHELSKKIIIDHPIDFEKQPFMGPLIDQKSQENYLLYMGMAKREGAEEVMRGKAIEKTYPGHYVTPSIHYMEKANPKSHFLTSELFGPNTCFVPFKEIEEAIQIANIPDYGLAASVFTESNDIFELCIRDIESGLMNLNRSTVGASSRLPFGGIKNSGNHRPAAVAMVDSCVYPMASLKVDSSKSEIDFSDITGLDL